MNTQGLVRRCFAITATASAVLCFCLPAFAGPNNVVQGIDLDKSFRAMGATNSNTPIMAFAFAIITLSFVVGIALEVKSDRPEYHKPIMVMIGFVALLAFYPSVASTVIRTTTAFGSLQNASVSDRVILSRAKQFDLSKMKMVSGRKRNDLAVARVNPDGTKTALTEAEMQARADDDGPGVLSQIALDSVGVFLEMIYLMLASVSYVFVASVLWALKIIQKVMLESLIAFGPFIIALASFPGPTRRLLAGWFMALIEVSAWGLVARVLSGYANAGLEDMSGDLMKQPNPFSHIAYNLLYAAAYSSIPLIAATIIRGTSAAGLGGTAFRAASGVATAGAAGAMAAGAGAMGMAGGGLRGPANAALDAAGGGGGGGGGGSGAAGGGGGAGGGGRGGDDASRSRREAFARNGALRKQERESDS